MLLAKYLSSSNVLFIKSSKTFGQTDSDIVSYDRRKLVSFEKRERIETEDEIEKNKKKEKRKNGKN